MTNEQMKTSVIGLFSSALLAGALTITVAQPANAISCNGDKGIVTCSGGEGNTPNPSIGGDPGFDPSPGPSDEGDEDTSVEAAID